MDAGVIGGFKAALGKVKFVAKVRIAVREDLGVRISEGTRGLVRGEGGVPTMTSEGVRGSEPKVRKCGV